MNDAEFASNASVALRTGVLAAAASCVLAGAAVSFSPEDWKWLVAYLVGIGLVIFWIVFIGRMVGGGLIEELGDNYPDLQRHPSIHNKLAEISESVGELRQQIEHISN